MTRFRTLLLALPLVLGCGAAQAAVSSWMPTEAAVSGWLPTLASGAPAAQLEVASLGRHRHYAALELRPVQERTALRQQALRPLQPAADLRLAEMARFRDR